MSFCILNNKRVNVSLRNDCQSRRLVIRSRCHWSQMNLFRTSVFFPSRQMIARRIMSVKKTSPHTERQASIKFESVGTSSREGDNGGISTDGVLIAAPFTVERAGFEGNACGERKRNCPRDISEAEVSQDGGEWVARGAEAPLDGRIVNDCRLKCPLRSGPRRAQWLDWQMVREICIRCEVFACQFCLRVVLGHLFAARSTVNFMEEIKKSGKKKIGRRI